MSKEIIVSAIILIAIIVLNICVSQHIDKKMNYVVTKLGELKGELEVENFDESQKKIDEIDEYWKNSENILSFFIEHDELEKVITELTSLKAYIKLEDSEEAIETLDKMTFIINHIEEKDDLKLKNIF